MTQSVVLSDKTGPVKIEAKVSGYREVALYAIGIYDEDTKVSKLMSLAFYRLLSHLLFSEVNLSPIFVSKQSHCFSII